MYRLLSLPVQAWTQWNEFYLGIETELSARASIPLDPAEPWKGQYSTRAKNHDNFRYGTIGYRNIRKILRLLQPGPEDVFYDIGCGMGRVLCLFAREPIRKCVGIEILDPLCEIARKNAAQLRGRKAPIEIICNDVTQADLSAGTIYFMFNPFGPETLRETFESIRRSIVQTPRTVQIVYYHSKHKSAIEPLPWLVETHDFPSFGGHPVTIWKSRSPS